MDNCNAITLPKGAKVVRDVKRVGNNLRVDYVFGGFSNVPLNGAYTTIETVINGVTYPPNTSIDYILNQIDSILVGGALAEVTKLAGENISSQMAVILDTDNKIYKYDITDISHYGKCIGLSKTAALSGDNIVVSLVGSEMSSAGSGWVAGVSYFISSGSLLTASPPSTGISKRIALGIDVDKILITNFEERILL